MKLRWIFPAVAAPALAMLVLGMLVLGMLVLGMLVLGESVPARAETVQISMQNLEISPAEVKARVGDTIEWTNKDVLAHTATARNGDWDVMLPPKNSGTLILKKAGTVEYYCRFHPNMKAVLIVAP